MFALKLILKVGWRVLQMKRSATNRVQILCSGEFWASFAFEEPPTGCRAEVVIQVKLARQNNHNTWCDWIYYSLLVVCLCKDVR